MCGRLVRIQCNNYDKSGNARPPESFYVPA